MVRSTPEVGDCALYAEAPVMAAETNDLDALFRRYSAYVAAVALRLLGRDDEVDDVVQEVFLAALRGLRQLREEGAVKG
jgi:RNA polymerase sigma-70 factor, ECF subfamily